MTDDDLPPFVPPSGYPHDPENVVQFVHPKAQQTRLVMPRYRLQAVRAYDMFPQTAHVETVCELVPEAA